MNQKPSLREDPQFVSRVLTGNSRKSDSNGRSGGPLLCGFPFCGRVSRQKYDADLITGDASAFSHSELSAPLRTHSALGFHGPSSGFSTDI